MDNIYKIKYTGENIEDVLLQNQAPNTAEKVVVTDDTAKIPPSIIEQDSSNRFVTDIEKGIWSGKADLVNGLVPSNQLPSYVDDVIEAINFTSFPLIGESSKIYIALNTNLTYRWSGSTYVEVSKSLAIGETSSTAFVGDKGKTAYDHSQLTTGNPHGTSVSDIGAESTSNKTTTMPGVPTDAQYPSTKLLYDQLAGKQPAGSYLVAGDISGKVDKETGKSLIEDAVLSRLANTSGNNTGDQTLSSLGAQSTTNLSTDITTDASSTTKYPSVKAIKDYTDTKQPMGSYLVANDIANKVDKEIGKSLIADTSVTRLLNTSGTNTGDNSTNSQYSGLINSKMNIDQTTPQTMVGTFTFPTIITKAPIGAISSTHLFENKDTLNTTTAYVTSNGDALFGITTLGREVAVTNKNKSYNIIKDPSSTVIMRKQTYYWDGSGYVVTNGIGIGQFALESNTGMFSNAFGQYSLQNNTGAYSNGFGTYSLQNNTGAYSNGFGTYSLLNNIGAYSNGFGEESLLQNIGAYSQAIGYKTLYYNQKDNNIAIGHNANSLFLDNTAENKTTLSNADINNSLDRITLIAHGFGSSNTYVNVKYSAISTGGQSPDGLVVGTIYQVRIVDNDTIEFRTNGRGTNIIDQGNGRHTFTPQYAYTNTICIGSNISSTKSNQVIIGNDDIVETVLKGNVVISGSISGVESTSNKVTSISSGSTNTQYPSAKLLYDQLAGKQATGSYLVAGDISGKVDKETGKSLIEDAVLSRLANTSGNNTGDETDTTIKTKLGITTLTGSNTGDQTLSSLGAQSTANLSTDITTDASSTTKYPSVKAIKEYADGLVVGLFDYRGGYDASINTFPTTGGSGLSGAIIVGDSWRITVVGTLGGEAVQISDVIIANINTPGDTLGNWTILNGNITYVPEDASNKVTSISSGSTNTQYPSALLMYNELSGKQPTGSYLVANNISGKMNIDQSTPQTMTGTFTLPTVITTNETINATYENSIAPSFLGTNWTATNGWSADGVGTQLTRVSNGTAGTITPSGTGATPVIGNTYKVIITCSPASGSITYSYGGVTGTPITATTITNYITATTTGKLIITGAASSTCTISSVSIQLMTQGTGTLNNFGDIKLYGKLLNSTGVNVMSISPAGIPYFNTNVSFGSKILVDNANGWIYAASGAGLANLTSSVNGRVGFYTTAPYGTIIDKNIASDTGSVLTTLQIGATPNGKLIDCMIGANIATGTSVAYIGTDGKVSGLLGRFGSSTDYSEFEADGTLKFNGLATVYKDLITPAINLRGGSTPPTFAVFQNGVWGSRFDDGVTDELHGIIELQHDYKEGSLLEVHVHWSPTTTNTGDCVWNFEYTVANMGTGIFGTTTTITSTTGHAGSGTINQHQYTSIGTIVGTNRKIGDIISFRVYRTGATDSFSGNAFLHSIGIHYEVDTIGSRTTSSK